MAVLEAYDTQPAFREGYQAYNNDLGIIMNPYSDPMLKYFQQWREGWLSAQKEEKDQEDRCEMDMYGQAWDKKLDLVGEI